MKNLKETISRSYKVALYASLTMDDFTHIGEVNYSDFDEHYQTLPEGQKRERPVEGYVRISEPVEIRFTAIDDESITQNAVAALDEEERKAYEELNKKLVRIRNYRNQLLTLTHQPEATAT